MSNRLKQLLTRSNSEITEARADRISRGVENSFKAKLMDVQSKIDMCEEKKERMMDMSASNNTTTKNAIDDLNAEGFVDKYCDLDEELFILNRQKNIYVASYKDLMGSAPDLSVDTIIDDSEEPTDEA